MPSLILETPADGRRIMEADKWLKYIYERYNISQQYYNGVEFIFRQCLMHERFNTSFMYENEEPVNFPIKKDQYLATLTNYLAKNKSRQYYGLHPLTLQKMDRIKSAEPTPRV